MNANALISSTGTWTGSSTSNSWSPNHHIGGVGKIYSATVGVNTTANESVVYTFPTGYVGGTCYLNHLPWNDSGYFDVFVCQSAAPSNDVFTCRVGDCNDVHNGSHYGHYDGVRVDCVASGYDSYDQVKIVARKGTLRLMG